MYNNNNNNNKMCLNQSQCSQTSLQVFEAYVKEFGPSFPISSKLISSIDDEIVLIIPGNVGDYKIGPDRNPPEVTHTDNCE